MLDWKVEVAVFRAVVLKKSTNSLNKTVEGIRNERKLFFNPYNELPYNR